MNNILIYNTEVELEFEDQYSRGFISIAEEPDGTVSLNAGESTFSSQEDYPIDTTDFCKEFPREEMIAWLEESLNLLKKD